MLPMSSIAAPSSAALPVAPLAPMAVLDDEHRQMLRMLDELRRLVGPEDALSDAARRQLAGELHRFFSEHARAHHALEEAHVFPALLDGADPVLKHQVERLIQDHGWLEQNWLELAPQVAAIADGLVGGDLELLREAANVFEALYQDHIVLEETLAYPEARRRAAAESAGVALRLRLLD